MRTTPHANYLAPSLHRNARIATIAFTGESTHTLGTHNIASHINGPARNAATHTKATVKFGLQVHPKLYYLKVRKSIETIDLEKDFISYKMSVFVSPITKIHFQCLTMKSDFDAV